MTSDLVMIDYGAGNVQSVRYALERLGVRAELSADPDRVARADRVLFPGVGAARASMAALRARGLAELIPRLEQPVLGICVGMQLLAAHSEEEDTPGLGVLPAARVRRFRPADPTREKVPHMGWNTLDAPRDWLPSTLAGRRVYYVHSYAMDVGPWTVATTDYAGFTFSAALRHGNFYGTQFHAEKSGDVGERVLQAFLGR